MKISHCNPPEGQIYCRPFVLECIILSEVRLINWQLSVKAWRGTGVYATFTMTRAWEIQCHISFQSKN